METEAQNLWERYKRMAAWAVAAIIFVILLVFVFQRPQEIGVGVWKLALLTIAAFAGYWIDRTAFPYARPHYLAESDDKDGVWTKDDTLGLVFAACMIRRALVMVGALVAMALAV